MANLELELKTDVSAAQINRLFDEVRSNAEGAKKALNEALGGTVTKKIVFENIVDDSGARRLIAVEKERLSVTDKVIAAQRQLDKVQEGSLTSLRQQVNSAKQLRDGIARYEASTRNVSAAWTAANQQLNKLNRELALASTSGFWDRIKVGLNAQGLVNFSNGLVQITQGLQAASITIGQVVGSINTLIQASAGLQQFSLAFEAIGAGAAGAQQALNESSRISLNLGVSIKTVRESFKQLTPVILNSGGSISDVSKVVEALSSRFAAFGISGDKARRVTNGVIQAFAKGKLQAEEFTQQIAEADPAFGTDFAKAIGVTVAELQKMIKAGEITSDVFLRGIIAIDKNATVYGKLGTSAKDAVEALAAGNVTIDQVQGKLESLGQLNLENLAKAFEPFTLAVLRIAAVVVDFLDRISKLESVKGLGSLFGGLANVIGTAVETILNATEGILRFADAINTLLGPLTKIPGLAEAFGVVILAKLIAPLAAFKQELAKTASEGRGFGAFLSKLALGAGKPLEDIAQKSGQIGPALANSFQRASKAIGDFSSRGDRARASLLELSKANVELSTRISGGESRLARFRQLLDASSASLNKAKQSANSFGLAGGSFAALETRTAKLQKIVSGLERNLGTLRSQKGAVGAALEVNRATVAGLGVLPTTLKAIQGASGLAVGAIKGLSSAVGGVVTAIGPLGFAMIAIAAATSSYNQINGQANAILEGSKQRVKALDESIKALGGSTEDAEAPITGLALAWAQFGLAINSIGEKINKFFSGAKKGAGETAELEESSRKAGKGFDGLAIGIGAVTGALAGARFGKFGIIIGGIAGALIALSATGSDAGVKLEELKKKVAAIGLSAQTESRKIVELVNALNKVSKAGTGGGGDTAKASAGYQQLKSALEGLRELQEQLTSQQQIYRAQVSRLGPEVAKAFPAYLKLQQLTKDLAKAEAAGILESPQQKAANAKQRKADLEEQIRLQKELAKAGVSDEALAKYGNLQNALKVVNSELKNVNAEVGTGTAVFNQYAAANGLLNAEQLKTANNSENLNKKLSDLQGLLALIDPSQQAGKWAEVNREIAQTTVELQKLEDSSKLIQDLEVAAQIQIGVDNGYLNNSIQNAQRVIQSLTSASYLIDIDSPQLVDVIWDLTNAETKLDELNGKRAEVIVSVMEAQGVQTLGQIDRYIQALNQQKISLSIDSSQLDQVLTKLQRAQQLAEAFGMTTKQLQNEIAKSQAESNIAGLQKAQAASQRYYQGQAEQQQKVIAGIQAEAAASDKAYQRRIANAQKIGAAIQASIDKEIAGIQRAAAERDKAYSKQIAALQAAGPAERALQEKEIAELRKQASNGATEDERLRAAAQLERIEKEKQIAQVQEEQARKREEDEAKLLKLQEDKQKAAEETEARITALEEERQAAQEEYAARLESAQARLQQIQEEGRQADLEYQDQIMANQETINRIAEEERAQRRAILEEVLAAKQGYQELGEASQQAADSTGTASENTSSLADAAGEANTALSSSATAAGTLRGELAGAASSATQIANELERAARAQSNINPQGSRWSGGPVSGGVTYTVNELGKEGFLSASGVLKPINKMPYSSWRAPGAGTVIPAHIMSQLDAPATGVKARKVTSVGGAPRNPAISLLKALRASLSPKTRENNGLDKLSEVQARQAVEIGKLSREIGELNRKKWDVNVSVRNNNGNAFLEAVNRMM